MRPRNFLKNPTGPSDIRYTNIVNRLKRSNPIYFYKEATISMLNSVEIGPFTYQLEFPAEFVTAHSKMFGDRPTFEMVDSDGKWPMAVTVKVFPMTRVFVYRNHGWKKFAVENRIQVGDFLFFSLISFSRFAVHIFRHKPVGRPIVQADRDAIQRALQEPADWTPNEIMCPASAQTPPPAAPSPEFVTTVSLPHMHVDAGFWVRHRRMLRTNVIQLQGPSKTVMKVEVRMYYGKMDTTYKLESGWTEFANTNMLNIGDTLVFYMVEPGCFKVGFMKDYRN